MINFLLALLIVSDLIGWLFFASELRLSKKKDEAIASYQKFSKTAEETIEALRSQNARLIQTVAMLHRGIQVESKRIEEFKLEGE